MTKEERAAERNRQADEYRKEQKRLERMARHPRSYDEARDLRLMGYR